MIREGFVKNFLQTFIGRSAIICIDFLLNVVIVRMAGPEGRGAYSLFTTTIVIMALIAGGGLQFSNIYMIGKKRERLNEVFSNSVIYSVTAGAFLLCAYYLLHDRIEIMLQGRNILKYGYYTFISLPFLLIFLNDMNILLGLQDIKRYNNIQVINSFLRLLLVAMAAAVLAGQKVNGIILGWTLATVASGIASMVFVFRNGARPALFDPAVFLESLKVGYRACIVNIVDFLLIRIDIYLIRFFLPLKFVGYYAIAAFFAESLLYVPNIIGDLLAPKVASDRTGKSAGFAGFAARSSVALVSLCGVGLACFGYPLMVLVFGVDFAVSYRVLLILLPAISVFSLQRILAKFYAGKGYPPIMYISALAGLFVSISAGLLLIPNFKIIGAACSTALAYLTKTAVIVIYFMKKTDTSLAGVLLADSDDLAKFKDKVRKAWLG